MTSTLKNEYSGPSIYILTAMIISPTQTPAPPPPTCGFATLCSSDAFSVVVRGLTLHFILDLRYVSRSVKAGVDLHLGDTYRSITSASPTVTYTTLVVPKLNIRCITSADVKHGPFQSMEAVCTRVSRCGRVVMYTLKYEIHRYPCYLYVVDGAARYVLPPTINTIYNITVYSVPSSIPLHTALDLCMSYSTSEASFNDVFNVDLVTKGDLIMRWPIPNYHSVGCNIQGLPEFFDIMTDTINHLLPV